MSTDNPSSVSVAQPLSLHGKLASIAVELTRFPKDQQVGGKGGYAFAGVDAMSDAIRKAMAERGVVMYPKHVEIVECAQYVRQRVNAEGQAYETVQWRTVVRATWVVSDGEEAVRVMSVGEALDTSDKSANKAQTAARKYAMIGLLNISTGDEPDPDGSRPGDEGEQRTGNASPQLPTPDVRATFRAKFREANAALGDDWRANFAKWLATETGAPKDNVATWLDRLRLDEEIGRWPDAMTAQRTEKVYNLLVRKLTETGGSS